MYLLQNASHSKTDPDSILLKLEQKEAIIKHLEKRVGPINVDDNIHSRSGNVSPIPHEVTQKDDFFAQNYTYTTNVCKLQLLLSF